MSTSTRLQHLVVLSVHTGGHESSVTGAGQGALMGGPTVVTPEIEGTPRRGGVRPFRALHDLEPDLQRIPRVWWVAIVTGTYLAVEAVVLVRHVLWRDEAQLWLVARSSRSFGELLVNMNYENRPLLWFLVIWPVARVTANPEPVKAVSFAVSAGVALLVTRFLPLARIEQVLVLSGFLMLIGYSTVSAGYMLGTLLTMLWFVAFSRNHLVGQFLAAALMGATHALFLVIAAPLWMLTLWTTVRRWRSLDESKRWGVGGSLMVSAAVMVWSAWLITPPPDYTYWSRGDIPWPAVPGKLLDYAGAAIRPPTFSLGQDSGIVVVGLSVLPLLTIAVIAVWRGRATLVAPVAGLILLTINGVVGYAPFWWHTGAVVVDLMLIVLMTRHVAGPTWFAPPVLWQSLGWWIVLAGQLLGTVFMPGSSMLGGVPYSGSKAAADVVASHCPNRCAVVTDDDIVSAGVSAYLGGQVIFHVNTNRWASFALWDRTLRSQRTPTWQMVREALTTNGPGAVAVLSTLRQPPDDFTVLAEPASAINGVERFLVVRLSR